MYELVLGFISDEEMASWCGKTLESYKKNRKRWCENTLTKFAEFKLVKGGVIINKIIEPIFSKSVRQEVKKKWRNYWGYNGNDLDSNKECWNKMKPAINSPLPSDKTGASYVSTFKCEEYGSARRNHKRKGRLGECKYTFCIILNGIPTEFDEQDCQIKKQLENKYLDTTYKEQKYETRALYSEYKRGELSKEEYEQALSELVETDLGWNIFEQEFNKALREKYKTNCLFVDFRQQLVDDAIKHYIEDNGGASAFDF